jgi:hypothetical protein
MKAFIRFCENKQHFWLATSKSKRVGSKMEGGGGGGAQFALESGAALLQVAFNSSCFFTQMAAIIQITHGTQDQYSRVSLPTLSWSGSRNTYTTKTAVFATMELYLY